MSVILQIFKFIQISIANAKILNTLKRASLSVRSTKRRTSLNSYNLLFYFNYDQILVIMFACLFVCGYPFSSSG